MEMTIYRPESRVRVLFPPVVLLSFLWAGVQALLLVYFRVVLLYPTAPVPSLGEFMTQVFAGSSAAGPAFATVLLVVNGLFVGLIWVKYASFRLLTRPEKLAATLTCGATTVLLGYLQWHWLELLRSAF